VSALYEFAEAVHISPETVTGLPALSGIALKLLFATIISKTNRKNLIWKSKLRDIYMGALRLKQIYENYDIPEDLDIEIITHTPMPQNDTEEMEVISAKLADGLISVTTAMNELQVENPELEIAKIIEEKLMFDKKMNIDERNLGKVSQE
jgi:hypothetical protein